MLTLDRPGDGDDTRMTLGWRRTVTHGETCYWSHGSSDGSRTFMGFNPARGVAVVALADAASGGGLDDIAWRVLDPLEAVDLKIVRALGPLCCHRPRSTACSARIATRRTTR